MYRNFTAILLQFIAIFSGLGDRNPPPPPQAHTNILFLPGTAQNCRPWNKPTFSFRSVVKYLRVVQGGIPV